jgi:hypothetical protein
MSRIAEDVLDQVALDPNTREVCRPLHDELIVSATHNTEKLATIIFRSRKRAVVRVVQVAREGGRWELVTESEVPIGGPTVDDRPERIEYPLREFHFLPGSGAAVTTTSIDSHGPS